MKGRRKDDALLTTEMDGRRVEESVDLLGTGGKGILLGGLKGVDREISGIDVALVLRWIRKRRLRKGPGEVSEREYSTTCTE